MGAVQRNVSVLKVFMPCFLCFKGFWCPPMGPQVSKKLVGQKNTAESLH